MFLGPGAPGRATRGRGIGGCVVGESADKINCQKSIGDAREVHVDWLCEHGTRYQCIKYNMPIVKDFSYFVTKSFLVINLVIKQF